MEIWKPVEGYENLYEVSNLGRIKSLSREWKITNRRNTNNFKTIEKILRPGYNSSGYAKIYLSKDGIAKEYYIHQLVATAFCEKQSYQTQVNHKNNRKKDNRANNLEWVSVSENLTRKCNNKGRYPKKILCVEENLVFENGNRAGEWILSLKVTESKRLETLSSNIRNACKNGNKKYKYHWKYI